ncbi:hypothetical protein [Lysobacter gummosus]|uniref:hypothetical protein n=1 Tax=Lysobacter gummosus TaxID=262324 RepID=UPI003643CAAB
MSNTASASPAWRRGLRPLPNRTSRTNCCIATASPASNSIPIGSRRSFWRPGARATNMDSRGRGPCSCRTRPAARRQPTMPSRPIVP